MFIQNSNFLNLAVYLPANHKRDNKFVTEER